MGIVLPSFEDHFDELAVGHLSFGSINVSWDFREILAERRKQEDYARRQQHLVTTDGRTLMPALGII